MNSAFVSALQELLRLAVIAALGVVIPGLIENVIPALALPEYVSLVLIAVLRAVDKYIHAAGGTTGLEFSFLEK